MRQSIRQQVGVRFQAVILSLLLFTPLTEAQAWPWDPDTSTAIPALREVIPGLHRGGRPNMPEAMKTLIELKIHTIINIDNDPDQAQLEKEQAEANGMRYIDSPMSAFSTPDEQQVNALLLALQDPANFPIFIHCMHGEDRTGLIMGLYRVKVQSWPASKAYQEMLDLGFHSILFPLDDYFREKTGLTELEAPRVRE